MTLASRLVAAAAAIFIAGCSSLATTENLASVQEFGQSRLGVAVKSLDSEEARRQAQVELDALLQAPLSSDDAVRVALAYSPSFQALLAQGAAQSAAATQSARLPNPVFALERLVRRENGMAEVELTRSLAFSIVDLLFIPARLELAGYQQQLLRMRGAGAVLQAAGQARQAWVRAVSAQQALAYHQQVQEAADAGAELAKRMQAVGNFSRLDRAREHAFYADATARLARARQSALASREALVRVLGLDEERARALNLPDRLPDVPAAPRDARALEQFALDQRIDVQIARAELARTARSQGLTRVASFVDGLHLKGIYTTETGLAPRKGFELAFPLPIFDFGDARRAEARALYMAALWRTAQVAVDAASQTRESHAAYRTAYDLARHYRDEVVPLRKVIADEMVLRYNGMLVSVFELLAESREQVASVILSLDAQRDFWLADAALQSTLLGNPMTGASMSVEMPAGEAPAARH